MGVRHVVMFRWNDGVGDDHAAAVDAALARLPALIPEIVDYRFGTDVGVNDGNFDYAVTADFASVDDYVTYRDHPDHREVVTGLVLPNVSDRAAVQFPI